jgi:hypothetical protein
MAGDATPRAHQHVSGELTPVFLRIWALVQKVKIRRLGLSLHVSDLAGIRKFQQAAFLKHSMKITRQNEDWHVGWAAPIR